VLTRSGPALLLLVVASACSSSSTNEASGGASGGCAKRSGNYTSHFSEHAGGTCGPIADQVTAAGSLGPSCTGTASETDNGCTEEISFDCAEQQTSLHVVGTTHWSSDGKAGSSVVQVSGTVGGVACTSTYDLTLTKL
jgi:hypothetical protein